MKCGTAFTPSGPLTFGDLEQIVVHGQRAHTAPDSIVEVRTPMAGDRRQVTLTVTNERWTPPPPPPDPADTTVDGSTNTTHEGTQHE